MNNWEREFCIEKIGSMNKAMSEVRDGLKLLQYEMMYKLQYHSLSLQDHAKCVRALGEMRMKLRRAM